MFVISYMQGRLIQRARQAHAPKPQGASISPCIIFENLHNTVSYAYFTRLRLLWLHDGVMFLLISLSVQLCKICSC